MKRGLIFSVVFFVMLFLLVGCKEQVESGEIAKCKHCSKQISNNVRVLEVYTWNADEYSVITKYIYCDKCGNENVTYKVRTRCDKCGNIYYTSTKTAKRKTETRDKTITEGFCSDKCRRWAKVDNTIDKASEKTGDVIGRATRGLIEGIKRHAR